MQNCKDCGASWNVKRTIDVCPFCGADLREKTTADSIEAAFKLIVERHGQDVFQSSVLLGLLGDYAPSLTKERNLVKVAIESGAYKAICSAPVTEREHVLNKYVSLLSDSYFIDESWARKVLEWCLGAFDIESSVEKGSIRSHDDFKPDIADSSPVNVDTFQEERPKRKTFWPFSGPDLIISDGVLRRCRSRKRSLELPANIHTIASGAFYSNNDINEITVPDSVKIIEKNAFAYCENLDSVVLESGVKEIGEWAFVNCKKLKHIVLPNSVISIGQYAFQGCLALATVQLSNEMVEIQEGTFFDCRALESVAFPQKLKAIKNKAFNGCASLKIVLLPEHLGFIASDAFSCCWSLKKVTVTSSIKVDPKTFDSRKVEIKYLNKSERI